MAAPVLAEQREEQVQATQASTSQRPPAAMATWLPHMTSFCCCLGLEGGAKLVGYLHLVTSAALVAACSWYAVQFGARADDAATAPDDVTLYGTWRRLAAGAAAASIAHVVLAAVLLYGVYNRRARAVRWWVVAAAALGAAAALAVLLAAILRGLADTGSDIFLSMLEGILFFGLLIYCILGVNSYYMMLKSCEDMEAPKIDY